MKLSPDETVFWAYGFITINMTLVMTWAIMLMLTVASWLITRRLKTDIHISHWQCILETLVTTINNQIRDIGLPCPEKYISYIGTLFLFIATSNICIIFPFYEPPTGSLSTTSALAISVFLAVPIFGISENGIRGYLRSYLKPSVIMMPFHLISEFTRTLALAVRLFGNIMSGEMIVGILLSITPLLFPIVMKALGLLVGMVQAYIFSVLATVYIAAAVQESKREE
ncbi:MAG: F0F1 ATP synthase subunit A [Bacteroidota bacterium]|nr:F0F1 ATP synthase subunit A [Bacteroidota bacterium]